jgi:hypothetical protein
VSVAAPNSARYGARGITVCTEWLDFDRYYADTGDAPDGMKKGTTSVTA